MWEYERKQQTKSTEALPCRQKHTVDVKKHMDRKASVPTYRKEYWREEDTGRTDPVQMRRTKKVQRIKPQQPQEQRSRPQPGRQDRVQNLIKKIYVDTHTEPAYDRMQAGEDTLVDEDTISEEEIFDGETADRMETLSRDEQIWLRDIGLNGLCGGWAALHRANPERFTAIWEALACWNGRGNIAQHMNRYCTLREPGVGWENYIISLTDSAVGIMKILEPTVGYRMLPDDITDELPEFHIAGMPAAPNKRRIVHVEAEGAGEVVYNCIVREPFLRNKQREPYVIHIETDYHHMSVRTRYINRAVLIEEIVETEYAGVVVRPDQETAETVLEHGIYLNKDSGAVPKAQDICLEFYSAVKSKKEPF